MSELSRLEIGASHLRVTGREVLENGGKGQQGKSERDRQGVREEG